MLVVISDLHLNDGTTCESVDKGAFQRFVSELRQLAESASWRKHTGKKEGVYEPLPSLDIVLLGDIFDLIRSDRWRFKDAYLPHFHHIPETARPWDKPEAYLPTLTTILAHILWHNRHSLRYLRRLSQSGLCIPATPDGSGTHTVGVRLHYMVGNHDWFFYVDHPGMRRLRQAACRALGLYQSADQPFPHQLNENTSAANALLGLALAHRVWLQHGDLYDSQNYHSALGRAASSLGDVVVVELLNRFPDVVFNELRTRFPRDKIHPQLLQALRELDNVRPATHAPIFVHDIARRIAWPHQKQIIIDTWRRCSDAVFNVPFVQEVGKVQPSALRTLRLINLAQRFLPAFLLRRLPALQNLFADPYAQAASNERYVLAGRCDYVIYGHTHLAKRLPLRVRPDRYRPTAQIYFNSGTWRPIHQLAREVWQRWPYATMHVMTWVAFYREDERYGRRYETWTGELDQHDHIA